MCEETTRIVINISGGNNQILPNATHAEQHFYGGRCVDPSQPVATEAMSSVPNLISRFAIYINNEEMRNRFTTQLRACLSAAEVGRTVVTMVQEVPGLTIDTAKTEPFITILLNLSTSVKSGISVPNFRKAITDAWLSKKA